MTTLRICEGRCDQCLFSENRIVSKARMRDIIKTARRDDSYFECHKHTMVGDHVMCRGWYESQPANTWTQIAERLGLVEFVPLPTKVAP